MTTEAAAAQDNTIEIDEERATQLLLTADGELSEMLEGILRCLFARFTTDGNNMTRKQLNEYCKACNNGTPFSDDEIQQIQEHFDSDENQCLTLVSCVSCCST